MKSKPFKTITEQCEILRTRNINIENIEFVKTYLLYNNYYTTINTYSKYLLVEKDIYNEDIKFEDIANIHYFDKDLKAVLFKYILEVENHFKSVLAYRYSEKFKDDDFSYLHLNNYSNTKILEVTKFISSISKIIQDKINNTKQDLSNENAISYYNRKYKSVPIWVLINFMTLGQTIKFYSFLDDSLKNEIAKDMNFFLSENLKTKTILTKEELIIYLKNIVEIRNVVAHNNKLLDYKCKKTMKFNKFLYDENIKNDKRQDVYCVILALKCFLEPNQYAQLNNKIRKIVTNLNKKVDSKYTSKVLKSLNFPEKWEIMNQNN